MRHQGSKVNERSKAEQSQDLVDQLNRKLIEKADAEIDKAKADREYTRVLTLKAKTWWKEATWFSAFAVLALGIYTASGQHDKTLVEIGKRTNELAEQRNKLDEARMKDDREKYGEFTKAKEMFMAQMRELPGKIQVAINTAVKPLQEKLARAEQNIKAKNAELAALKASQKVADAAPQNSGKETER